MRNDRIYMLVLLLLPLVFVGLSNIVFDFNGLYGQDAHRYFQYVGELESYFKDGNVPGEFHWPILYPLAGFLLKSTLGINAALSLQLVSAFSLGVSGVFIFKILRGQHPNSVFLFSLIFLIFCPQLLAASVICMSDLLAMMWVVLAWYFYFEWKENGKIISAFNLCAMAALATISRYPALLLIIVPLAFAFFKLLSKKKWWALLMPFAFVLFCLPEFTLHSSVQNVSESYLLNHWDLGNLFQSSFQTNDGAQVHRFINLLYITYPVWHPAYFLLGLPLALYAVFKFPRERVFWVLPVSVLVYLLFLGGLEIQSRRFLILVFPLVLIVVYRLGFGAMMNTFSIRKLGLCVFFLMIFQGAIAAYYLRPLVEMNHFEQKLAKDLQPYEGKELYVFYWDISLKSYGAQFEFHNLWEENVESHRLGDLILFNPEELEAQWEGSQVMDNWNFVNQNYNLEVLKTWPNGWKLYEVR